VILNIKEKVVRGERSTYVIELILEMRKQGWLWTEELPEWFIKLFTKEYDTVLDPFMGSGTTLIVANRIKRHSIGIDIVPEYYEMVCFSLS
jgi:hypothetical protein